MDRKETGEYLRRDSISTMEQFLLYMADQIQSLKLTENEKRSLAIVYHRLWWFRDNEIKQYFSRSESFEEYPSFIFEKYKLSAEQDIKSLVLARKSLSKEKSSAELLTLFRADMAKTIDFFSKGKVGAAPSETPSILYIDGNGNFSHGDKTKFCYAMGATSNRFKILKYLAENKGLQTIDDIAAFLGLDHSGKQGIRTEIGKIKQNIKKFLDLDDVIESKKDSGYGISSKYRIAVAK